MAKKPRAPRKATGKVMRRLGDVYSAILLQTFRDDIDYLVSHVVPTPATTKELQLVFEAHRQMAVSPTAFRSWLKLADRSPRTVTTFYQDPFTPLPPTITANRPAAKVNRDTALAAIERHTGGSNLDMPERSLPIVDPGALPVGTPTTPIEMTPEQRRAFFAESDNFQRTAADLLPGGVATVSGNPVA